MLNDLDNLFKFDKTNIHLAGKVAAKAYFDADDFTIASKDPRRDTTLNNSHNYCIDHQLTYSRHVVDPMKYKIECMIKGRINRPPYEGNVTVWIKEDESLKQAVARELSRTSFQIDKVYPDEVIIHNSTRID